MMTAAAQWKIEEIDPVHLLAIGFEPEAKCRGQDLGRARRTPPQGDDPNSRPRVRAEGCRAGGPPALDHQGEELGTIVGAQSGFEFEGEEQVAGSTEEE
jgi:hypothetical protein